MSIVVNCAECGQTARVKDELAGRSIRCRAGGESIPVPGGDEDDPGEGYALHSPRPARPRAVRRRRSDRGGLGVVGKIVSVCAAVAIGVTVILAKFMVRAGI